MDNLTIEEWMEKYPYIKKMSEYTLFTSKEEIDIINNSEKIKMGSKDVPIEFLKRILNNDYYFEYASRFFINATNKFSVAYIIGGDVAGNIYFDRSVIIRCLDELIKTGKIVLTEIEKQRYDSLKGSITLKKFMEKHSGNNYNIVIDGKNYSILTDKLFSVMNLSQEEFDSLCLNSDIKEIYGIKKEYFIYALLKFLKENKSLEDYLMPDNILDHFNKMNSFQIIDTEAINKHLSTTDNVYKKVVLDSTLKNKILEGLPNDANDLEKAIYIYIKMCKLLTYDEEYYAVNQKGIATQKHKKTEYVSTITLDNNKVVCFEFNLIYSKLLSELGIHFTSDYKGRVGEAYGDGHANLEFRWDKFLVSADSVTSILQGDIMRVKLNQPLVGIKCINSNEQTKKEFSDALTKMYKLISIQNKDLNSGREVNSEETLDELLKEYSIVTDNISNISLDERLSILIDKVNKTKMIGIDSLSYVIQLKRILFTEEQRKNNIVITILRNNEPFDKGRVAMASVIISLNLSGFENNPNETSYYYYNPNHELTPITKEELQSKFDNGLFEYIEDNDPRIPGIEERKGFQI